MELCLQITKRHRLPRSANAWSVRNRFCYCRARPPRSVL